MTLISIVGTSSTTLRTSSITFDHGFWGKRFPMARLRQRRGTSTERGLSQVSSGPDRFMRVLSDRLPPRARVLLRVCGPLVMLICPSALSRRLGDKPEG